MVCYNNSEPIKIGLLIQHDQSAQQSWSDVFVRVLSSNHSAPKGGCLSFEVSLIYIYLGAITMKQVLLEGNSYLSNSYYSRKYGESI